MQPAGGLERPSRVHPRSVRTAPLIAFTIAVLATLAPAERVAACDCALLEPAQAVRDADAAFVGRLESVAAPDLGRQNGADASWHWSLERSRDPIDVSGITLVGAVQDGANCGVEFGVGERWLVIAHLDGSVLRTNGCLPNRPLDGAGAELDAEVAALLPVVVDSAATNEARGNLPVSPWAIAAGLLVVAVASVVAFRREASS